MSRYVLERVVHGLFVLFGVMLVSFALVHLTGDPVAAMLGPDARNVDIDQARQDLGFNDPLPLQFLRHVANIARGDLGRSFLYRAPTLPLILERLPATLVLALVAMAVNLAISVPIGIISAVKRGGIVDWIGTTLIFIGQSMPVFWLGIMLILVLSLGLKWLPASGFGAANIIMPAFVLGFHSAAYQTRLLRSAMLEVLNQDYMRTARAKGLAERLVLLRHALRNAMLPFVTATGTQFAVLMGGAVVVEAVFAWPGLGTLAVQAINNRDVNLVVATTLVFAVFILVVNLTVDLLYGVIDPRVKV